MPKKKKINPHLTKMALELLEHCGGNLTERQIDLYFKGSMLSLETQDEIIAEAKELQKDMYP